MPAIFGNFLSGGMDVCTTATQVSFTHASYANLPVVSSPNTLWLTVDPVGTPEIVQVTIHNAASTNIFVARGQQGTTARTSWPSGTPWVATLTASDANVLGVAGGSWNAWTPNISTGTLGNGTSVGRYIQIGKTVIANGLITRGSTTSFATGLVVDLPVTGQSTVVQAAASVVYGQGLLLSVGAGLLSTTNITFVAQNAAGTYLSSATLTNSIPWTWATGNTVTFQVIYEAA